MSTMDDGLRALVADSEPFGTVVAAAGAAILGAAAMAVVRRLTRPWSEPDDLIETRQGVQKYRDWLRTRPPRPPAPPHRQALDDLNRALFPILEKYQEYVPPDAIEAAEEGRLAAWEALLTAVRAVPEEAIWDMNDATRPVLRKYRTYVQDDVGRELHPPALRRFRGTYDGDPAFNVDNINNLLSWIEPELDRDLDIAARKSRELSERGVN
jgi:hypothetical protein